MTTDTQSILDAVPDAMIVANAEGRIVRVNTNAERMFGYTREELLGKPVEMLIPTRYRARHEIHRATYARHTNVRPMGSGLDLFGVRKDGTEVPVEVSLSPVETVSGRQVWAAVRDVTERKRAEAEARLTMTRLLSAVESTQDAFALYDADDRLVLCNSAFRSSLPVSLPGKVIGLKFEEILDTLLAYDHFDLGAETKSDFRRRRLAYHAAPEGVFDFRTTEGRNHRVIERRTGERDTVITIWDLTDDVRRENELRDAQRAAEAASVAKSEFLSSMSHELRTPLNAVLGFAQLLQRDKKTPLTEKQQGMLQHVVRGGEHLLRLIDDILDLSRIEAGNMGLSVELFRVPEVIREVMNILSPLAARVGVELDAAPIPEDVPLAFADRTRVVQILVNFGSNAIKYGRAGGRATFVVSGAPDNHVRVTVTDTGHGIPADKQDRIFQPFFRAGQETGTIEGTGIGLAITKRLAEAMGGTVGFRSTPGHGSDFWVQFPGQAAPAVPAFEVPAPVSRGGGIYAGPKKTVLYVEDNPSNVAFMEAVLVGFENVSLLTSPTAEIGIELARAHQPELVILDINLPGISGYEALRRLREGPETEAIPVVALSASATERDKKRAKEAGFLRYMTKPVRVDELTEVLEQILGA